MKYSKTTSKGITLLIAVIITSAALAVGLGVYSLLVGEIKISGTEKQSVSSFFASDSAAECFLYWKYKKDVSGFSAPFAFATTTDDGIGPSNSNTIQCNGTNFEVGGPNASANCAADPVNCAHSGGGYDNLINISFSDDACARLEVRTFYDSSLPNTVRFAELRTYGESAPCGSTLTGTAQRSGTGVRFVF